MERVRVAGWCHGSHAAWCCWALQCPGCCCRLWGSRLPVAQEAALFLPPLSPIPTVVLSQVLETLGDICRISGKTPAPVWVPVLQ